MTKPRKYQAQDLKRVDPEFNGRLVVAYEMGLGKTFFALKYLNDRPKIKLAVVVCPASIKWVWEYEARKHFGMRAEVLSGTKPRKRQLLSQPRLIVINYDILKFWVRRLRKMRPELVIVDESHYIASPAAQRTNALRYLCYDLIVDDEGDDEQLVKRVPRLLCLSGTPLVNRPIELWTTLNLLNPRRWPSYSKFGHKFCGPEKSERWGWQFKGASNVALLNRKLKRHMIRRLASDVLDELPPLVRSVVPLEIENRRDYDKAEKDFIGWLTEHYGKGRAIRAAKSERLVRFGYLKQLAADLKFKAACCWIDDFLAGCNRKLLVFGVHRRFLEALRDKYEGQCVMVHGGVTGERRRLAVEQFLKSDRTRLFFGQIKATGVGWSAKGVRDVAFLEYPWAPGVVSQAMKRAHGLGRGVEGKRTNAYFLFAKETIEEKLLEIIQRKQRVLNRFLEGKGKGDNLDVFDQLQRMYLAA